MKVNFHKAKEIYDSLEKPEKPDPSLPLPLWIQRLKEIDHCSQEKEKDHNHGNGKENEHL